MPLRDFGSPGRSGPQREDSILRDRTRRRSLPPKFSENVLDAVLPYTSQRPPMALNSPVVARERRSDRAAADAREQIRRVVIQLDQPTYMTVMGQRGELAARRDIYEA